MENKIKYLIIEDEFGNRIPVIFSAALSHKECAGKMKVISAGFCEIHYIKGKVKIECYGHSEGLGIKSNPEKDNILMEVYIT